MNTLAASLVPVKSNAVHTFAAGLFPNRYGLRAPVGGATVNGKVYKGGQFCLPYDVANPHGEPAPVVLAIDGFTYEVEGINAAPEIGTHAYSLHKRETNNRYFVILDNCGEVVCDCPSFVFRKAGTGQPCKHGRALIAAGHLPAPKSMPLPPFSQRADQGHAPASKPTRPRRFEPTPEDFRLAAAMFNA